MGGKGNVHGMSEQGRRKSLERETKTHLLQLFHGNFERICFSFQFHHHWSTHTAGEGGGRNERGKENY